ncbi:MAG: helix-turn-helix domain containing protein [Sulfurovum sp.]|nr:helix-turn-helix domain containing protein [Sulfurovum sp.]
MNANDLIEILMDYYNVSSNNELAIKLNMQPSSVSSWKNRNSVNAIKRKCRELGIYKEIFGDMNVQTVISNEGQNAQNVWGDQMSSPANQNEKKINDEVDPATYNLFLEAYKKAIEENNLKSFRLHLMEY